MRAVLSILLALCALRASAEPLDLSRQELNPGDKAALREGGYTLGKEKLLKPDGRPVESEEFPELLRRIRTQRRLAAVERLSKLYDAYAARGSLAPEELAEARRILEVDADVLPDDVRRSFGRVAFPDAAPPDDLKAKASASPAAAPSPEAATIAAGAVFEAGPSPGAAPLPPSASPSASPSAKAPAASIDFHVPDAAYLKWADARIDKTAYDDRVKALLRRMAANSLQEDGRVALDVIERDKPRIEIGDTDSPNATGESWGPTGRGEGWVMVSDRIMAVKRGKGEFRTAWTHPESYKSALGFVPAPIFEQGETRPLAQEYLSLTLLHELTHRDTSRLGGESTLVTELRSHFAEFRGNDLLEERLKKSSTNDDYRLWRRDPRAYEREMIRTYATTFQKIDSRADEIEGKRRELKRLIALPDEELEQERQAEARKTRNGLYDQRLALTEDLHKAGLITLGEWNRAQAHVRAQRDEALDKHFASEEYRNESYRETLRGRLRRLDEDERLYKEVWEWDEAWRKQRFQR